MEDDTVRPSPRIRAIFASMAVQIRNAHGWYDVSECVSDMPNVHPECSPSIPFGVVLGL